MRLVRATDEYGMLSVHQLTLGMLPDAAASEDERRRAAIARLQTRAVASGRAWVATLTRAIGAAWAHEAHGDTIRLTIRRNLGVRPAELTALARTITPAHVEIVTGYDEGFIVGVSEVGNDAV
jgi:hypothetical protein